MAHVHSNNICSKHFATAQNHKTTRFQSNQKSPITVFDRNLPNLMLVHWCRSMVSTTSGSMAHWLAVSSLLVAVYGWKVTVLPCGWSVANGWITWGYPAGDRWVCQVAWAGVCELCCGVCCPKITKRKTQCRHYQRIRGTLRDNSHLGVSFLKLGSGTPKHQICFPVCLGTAGSAFRSVSSWVDCPHPQLQRNLSLNDTGRNSWNLTKCIVSSWHLDAW